MVSALPAAQSAASNTVTIYEADKTAQPNRPTSFGRVFVAGEIAGCPQPVVNGTPTSAANWQADVKNRWPDGSVKFALISLLTPISAAGHSTITFQNSPSCNNAGYLTSPGMANFNSGNWDAQIRVTPGAPASSAAVWIISAKKMLAASDPGGNALGDCKNDYWQEGPVVTTVIVQDCTSASAFDFGWKWNGANMASDGARSSYSGSNSLASFHPMFILHFYPSLNAVECEEIIELPWNTRRQDQLADLSFATEDASGALHTRWSRTGARVIASVAAVSTVNNPPAVSTMQLTAASANFVSTDVGLPVCVAPNYSSVPTCGTIQSVKSSTIAVMALPTGSGGLSGRGFTAWMDLQSVASRHRKTFWSGTAPGHVRIDHNAAYLFATKALPNYDLANAYINPANGYYPGGKCCDFGWTGWKSTDKGDIGGFGTLNVAYSSALEGAPLQRADLAYLYNMSSCGSANSSCAEAWQQLTGTTAIGDLSSHAGTDNSNIAGSDAVGGAGMWDNIGNVPFHFREGQSTPTRNGNNGQGGSANCFYVSNFENKNAKQNTVVNPPSKAACLGNGDGGVPDPSGPNDATGRAISAHAHSDSVPIGNGFGGAAPVGSIFPILDGWDVIDGGPYHWLDYEYLPYLLSGSPYYLENLYQAAAYSSLNNSDALDSAGIFNVYNSGIIFRWYAWAMQNASRAAFAAPDGSAEASYWQSVMNSNLEFLEGSLGVTGTALTPSSSQGNFALSGTLTNFNINTANRWDLGRYVAVTGNACTTNGSGTCKIVAPTLHQWAQGGCNSAGAGGANPTFSPTVVSGGAQYWMYWYVITVLGEIRDMGYNQAAGVHNQTEQFLEGMTLSPTNNPWYALASYAQPLTTGGSSACPGSQGQNLPFFTRYGTSSGFFGGWSNAYGNPTTPTSQGNFSYTPASGAISTGNFPCSDHGYSLLARAAGTFLPSYGVNESDADGTYTPTNAWSWLNSNVPFFGNAAYRALRNDCVAKSDVQIKWALAPRK